MKEHFLDLWKYNDWGNRKVLEKLVSNKINNDIIFGLMSHILSAQFIWYLRIIKKPTSVFPIWEVYKLRELFSMNEDSTNNWLSMLENNTVLDTKYTYQNLKGDTHSSTLEQIMTHVINHGTHHRAQISTLLKQEEIQPPVLDYITYSRL